MGCYLISIWYDEILMLETAGVEPTVDLTAKGVCNGLLNVYEMFVSQFTMHINIAFDFYD